MKKQFIVFFTLVTFSLTSFGQSPEGINYQAVIRDASSNILTNQTVGIQFKLLQGTPPVLATIYTETHTATTDNFGMVALVIGTGTTGDDFSTIDWSNGPYSLEIAADVSGGTSYSVLGTQQLMSVPYALYAKTSGSAAPSSEITDTDNNTKIQVEESANEDIIRFDLAGTEQWKMVGANLVPVNSGRSIFIGEGAGHNDNLTEHRNVFIGYNTGLTNATGYGNTATGGDALRSNIGGFNNTATGAYSLNNNASGNYNTAMGSGALKGNILGSKNTAIGYNANVLSNSLNNTTAIGNEAKVATSNSLILGGTGANAVNVGIGTDSPTELLTLAGTSGTDGILFPDNTLQTTAFTGIATTNEITDADNNTKIQVEETANEDIIRFDVAGTEAMVVNSNGNVGIGTGSPTELLTLSGTSGIDGILFPDNTLQTTAFTGTATADEITDGDNNTKIQVEKNSNEDIIRFDLAGIEQWTMTGARLEPQNSGNSIFIGVNAGLNDDLSANQNIFIGTSSGTSATNQIQNTAIGNSSLENLNSGFGNTVYGHETGKFVQTGSNNTIIGRLSGRGSANHTKNNNTFLGAQSGEISEASNNTYIGFQSGQSNVTGTGNLFIGMRSGQNELGSNKLYIDNSNTASPLIYGEFDNDLLRVNGTLNINNAFSFPTIDGTANQFLQTDGAGNLTWQTHTGIVQDVIADADSNTKIQVEKTFDDDKIRFDLAGTEHMVLEMNGNSSRLRFPSNNGNFLIGDQISSTITGGNNFIFGIGAGSVLTSANSNLFHGRFSGKNTTTGSYNVFIGEKTGHENITGSNNVFLGESAGFNNMGNNSVFLGFKAGYNETTGNKLYIANSTTTTPLIYGEFDNTLLRVNGDLETTGNSDVTGNLTVSGATKIGSNGTYLNGIIKKTVNVNLPNISSNSVLHQNMTVPGATVGATVFVSPANQLLGSCFIGYARVVSDNTVEVTFLNEGSNGQDHPAMNFFITVIK